jgi:Survival protein SurE
VLSGINLGPNLGNGIWHSGTVAAAKQAALMGMPGIALSIPVVKDEPNFDALWRNAGKIEEARGVRRMPESLVPCGFLRLANPGFFGLVPTTAYAEIRRVWHTMKQGELADRLIDFLATNSLQDPTERATENNQLRLWTRIGRPAYY